MIISILYGKKGRNLDIEMKGEECTVKYLKTKIENKTKFKIFKRRRISKEHVILKYNGNLLNEDDIIKNQDKLEIYLKVKWKNYEDNRDYECELSYNCRVQELIDKCSKIYLSNFQFYIRGKICDSRKFLRQYLRKGEKVFIARESKEIVGEVKFKEEENQCETDKVKISLTIRNYIEDADIGCDNNIKIESDCNLKNLRQIIAEKMNIGICNFQLYHNDVIMDNDDFNLKNNDIVIVKSPKLPKDFGEQFIVNLQNLATNTEQKLMIDDFQTVGALKAVLREQYNVKMSRIGLWLDGREMIDNGQVIREMEIENGATVQVRVAAAEKTDEAEVVGDITLRVVKGLEAAEEEEVRVTVPGDATVDALRAEIEKAMSLAGSEYVLSHGGEVLRKENSLATYGLSDGGTVLVSGSVLVRFFVAGNNSSAKVNRYAFSANDTVAQLKARITRKVNLDAKFINLSYDGQVLEDEMVLAEHGIENDSYLMMLSTLAGGHRTFF